MTSRRWALAMVVMVAFILFDIAFAWLTYPHFDNGAGQRIKKDRWMLHPLDRSAPPDVERLLAGDFWGQVSNKEKAPSQSLGNLTTAEASVIRRRVRAIVGAPGDWQVLFEVDQKYLRLKEGDLLPGTQWKLLTVNSDVLVLAQKGQATQELSLYSEKVHVEARPVGDLGADNTSINNAP